MDRPSAASTRGRPTTNTSHPRHRSTRRDATREARTAGAFAGARGETRSRGLEGQRPESTLAMGIVLAAWTHLPQLAARRDARLGARLRAHSRTDALAPHGSLAEVLEARRGTVSRLPGGAPLAARKRPLTVGF